MKIASIKLKNFKRFADLSIVDLPPAKLIVLTGPNGSGKSSLFDSFANWKASRGGLHGFRENDPYYSRDPNSAASFEQAVITWHGNGPRSNLEIRRSLHIRSSYRNEPSFVTAGLNAITPALDEMKLVRLIEQDSDVSNNYTRIASRMLEASFAEDSREKTVGVLQDELLLDLRSAIKNIFGGSFAFLDLGSPLEAGTFNFSKGSIARYPYMNLSGGEKAAFDLVLNLVVKKGEFNDTVYCIDEPEAHMNTKLQGALLKELLRLLPQSCQLWIATHSIGMLNAARQLYEADSNNVVFLNFGDADFDKPAILRPVKPTKSFWRSVLSVALDDIADLVVPGIIVVCEGNPRSAVVGKNAEHDAKCYRAIFNESGGDIEFLSAGNSRDVQTDRLAVMSSIKKIAAGVRVIPLIDRDGHAPADVVSLENDGYRVLSRRHLECYFYDDEILSALCDNVGKSSEKARILQIKKDAIAASVARNNLPDDMKSAAGEIFSKVVHALGITQGGNSKEAFDLNTLCPLITQGTQVYQELRRDIFG